jgi:competence protein ComEA helix-hairpin-helix repeat region
MIKLNKNEERIIIAVIALIIIIAGIIKLGIFKESSVDIIQDDPPVKSDKVEEKPESIFIYVTGEVKNPGVYELKEGSRISDLVDAAGWFTENADETSVNLAGKLSDEQHINIGKKVVDAGGTEAASPAKGSIINGKININTATAKELDDFLPGIGETLANNIVNYRTKNGRFKTIDEITRVDRIGSGKRFEEIKDLITVN